MDIGYKEVVSKVNPSKLFWTGYQSLRIKSYVCSILYDDSEHDIWDYCTPFYGWNIEGKHEGVWL
jgi:hypothetical protein